MKHPFDFSEKVIIDGPLVIGDDEPVTKYRAESDGRTFWAYNGMEVFYEDERMYHALDEISRLRNVVRLAAKDSGVGIFTCTFEALGEICEHCICARSGGENNQ